MNEVSHEIKIMAGIGHVCLQYSRLEMMLVGMIFALLKLDEHRGAIATGGMDLKARFAVSKALLEEMRAPNALFRRLQAIQTELNKKKMIERRNQAVHGAHKWQGGAYTLTMLRYPKAEREQEVTPDALAQLGAQLCELGNLAYDLLGDIERWTLRKHGPVDSGDDIRGAAAVSLSELAKRLYASVKHLWRGLFR